jgi:hypothetical protein
MKIPLTLLSKIGVITNVGLYMGGDKPIEHCLRRAIGASSGASKPYFFTWTWTWTFFVIVPVLTIRPLFVTWNFGT